MQENIKNQLQVGQCILTHITTTRSQEIEIIPADLLKRFQDFFQ
jgi:hypothetical protein